MSVDGPSPNEAKIVKADDLSAGDRRDFLAEFDVVKYPCCSDFNSDDLALDFSSRNHFHSYNCTDGVGVKPSRREVGQITACHRRVGRHVPLLVAALLRLMHRLIAGSKVSANVDLSKSSDAP